MATKKSAKIQVGDCVVMRDPHRKFLTSTTGGTVFKVLAIDGVALTLEGPMNRHPKRRRQEIMGAHQFKKVACPRPDPDWNDVSPSHATKKKSPAQLDSEIAETLATAKAREISDRRIAALTALGEDVRNTPAWRDAMSERRMINFRSGSKGRATIKREPWWKGKFETDPGPEVAEIFRKNERDTARRIKEVSSSRQAALAWLERVGSWPSSDSNIRKITAAAEKRLARSHSKIRSSAVKRGSQSSRRRRRP